ncbi:MAG: hypothetical protein KBF88_16600, partial [Polyangiaceae bacterium]|nr:hypothetical protein [Polyangiaceae bacterium]
MNLTVRALYFPTILALFVGGCSEKTSSMEGRPVGGKEAGVQGTGSVPTPAPLAGDASVAAGALPKPVETDPRKATLEWFRTVLPSGGVATDESGKIVLRHQLASSETPASIAKLYLPFSKIYLEEDLAEAIAKRIAKSAGTIEIPSPIQAKFKSADEERLGWPKDLSLRGIYLGGNFARQTWIETLDKMVARGMNAVVLDSKDYMGPVVYPSKVALAVETGATKHAPIRDMARTIRFAHDRGIRIILRISCFHDPFMMKAKPDLSLKYTNGKPAPYEWIDPVNKDAQDYVIDLVKEG